MLEEVPEITSATITTGTSTSENNSSNIEE